MKTKHEMKLKRAEKIAEEYVCSRCWNSLEVVETGTKYGYPVCRNSQNGLCDGGNGFISYESVEIMKNEDAVDYSLVKESYPQWTNGGAE